MRLMTRVLTGAATLSLAGGMALAAIPSAMAAPAHRHPVPECFTINATHIHEWAKAGGGSVKNTVLGGVPEGSTFTSYTTPSSVVGGQKWVYGTDSATSLGFGYVGLDYLKTAKCTSGKPVVHKHRHRHCTTKLCHR